MRGDLVERLSAELVSANKHGDTDLADVLREAAAALRAVREAPVVFVDDDDLIFAATRAGYYNGTRVRIVPAGDGE